MGTLHAPDLGQLNVEQPRELIQRPKAREWQWAERFGESVVFHKRSSYWDGGRVIGQRSEAEKVRSSSPREGESHFVSMSPPPVDSDSFIRFSRWVVTL